MSNVMLNGIRRLSDPWLKSEASSKQSPGWLSNPYAFLFITVSLLAIADWPWRWLFSGTPILIYLLLLGQSQGYRVFPAVPLWTFIITLNLVYAVAATSWLLYGTFFLTCYPFILVISIYQFSAASKIARRLLSRVLGQLHFVNDKIAFFNIPALEIDTDVDGLMVVRGLTVSLLNLTIEAHGLEVGIKLSDDMELAMLVDKVKVSLFRRIEIDDVYANIKGGEYEMTFGNLAEKTEDEAGAALMVANTPLLVAAAQTAGPQKPQRIKMTRKLTDGRPPENVSAEDGFKQMTQFAPDTEKAEEKYEAALENIRKTSAIRESRHKVRKADKEADDDDSRNLDVNDSKDMRAAICSVLHDTPSIPHPPEKSVRVTTLKKMSNPTTKKFMHRLPFLLRLLLNPAAYFHPITIKSITAGGSGKWIQHLLTDKVFKHYGSNDAGIRKLEKRVSSWLSDANFVLQLVDVTASGQVPITPSYDIVNQLKFDDVMAYRTLPKEVDLKQVVRLGGADAYVALPAYLLPHHEHLLPPVPDAEAESETAAEVEEADGKPKTVQKQKDLEQVRKDEVNGKFSVHVRLPAVLDQELLDFVAALVKATKVIEMEKDPGLSPIPDQAETPPEPEHDADQSTESDIEDDAASIMSTSTTATTETTATTTSTLGKFSVGNLSKMLRTGTSMNNDDGGSSSTANPPKRSLKRLNKKIMNGMRRVAVDAVANDRWIARLVGRITKQLETAQGELGYSGDIPIALKPYRDAAEPYSKLLP